VTNRNTEIFLERRPTSLQLQLCKYLSKCHLQWVRLHIYKHIYIYICTYMYIHLYMYTYVCTYIYAFWYLYIHIHMYITWRAHQAGPHEQTTPHVQGGRDRQPRNSPLHKFLRSQLPAQFTMHNNSRAHILSIFPSGTLASGIFFFFTVNRWNICYSESRPTKRDLRRLFVTGVEQSRIRELYSEPVEYLW